MNSTQLPYHLRQNKHVERRLFIDLLEHVDRWRPLKSYLYVGFGGIHFEDFKLLHSHFAMTKMLSIENQEWVVPRQLHNKPYGCIDLELCESAEFIRTLDKFRDQYQAPNLLCWLDYANPSELAAQLNDIKAILPSLLANDILKVTLNASPKALATMAKKGEDIHEKRLEVLRGILGTQFLAEGVTSEQMKDDQFPDVLSAAFQRVVAEAMKESPSLVFQPIGTYVYKDSSQMITFTGILLDANDLDNFIRTSGLGSFELAGLAWQLERVDVPDLSLREKLTLDQTIFKKTPAEIEDSIKFKLEEDPEESLRQIESYVKFYRYYPSFHRVVV